MNNTPDLTVNTACISELKNTCDDHLKAYFSSQTGAAYTTCHKHEDTKLVLGYVSCVIAAAVSIYAYVTPFDKINRAVILGVVAYFLLNGALSLYTMLVEKDIVYEGSRNLGDKNGPIEKIRVRATTKAYTPIYNMVFELFKFPANASPDSVTKPFTTMTFELPFTSFFDETGLFVHTIFELEMERCLKVVREQKGSIKDNVSTKSKKKK